MGLFRIFDRNINVPLLQEVKAQKDKIMVKAFGQTIEMFPQEEHNEGETKDGKGGRLTLKNHRWHLSDEYDGGKKEPWEMPVEHSKDPAQENLFSDKEESGQEQEKEPTNKEAQGNETPYSSQLDLFKTAPDTKTEIKSRSAIRADKIEKTKEIEKLANYFINQAENEKDIFLRDLDELNGDKKINEDFRAFAVKPRQMVMHEIKHNEAESGKMGLTGGALRGILIASPDSAKGKLSSKGYTEVTPIHEAGENDSINFHKFEVSKGGEDSTKRTVIVTDEEHAKVFIELQQVRNPINETRLGIECKKYSESIPEFNAVKNQLFSTVGNGKGVCVITGGMAGAGKSSCLDKKIYKNKVKIDPDELKFILAELRGGDIEDVKKNPAKYHEESSVLAKHLVRQAIREGKDVVYDSTMKGEKTFLDTIATAHSAGYQVDGQFVHIPAEEGMKRDRIRGEHGGRALGKDLYMKLYGDYRTHKNFLKNKNLLDTYTMYDNSTPLGVDPAVVARKTAYGEKIKDDKRLDIIQKLIYNAVSKVKKSIGRLNRWLKK